MAKKNRLHRPHVVVPSFKPGSERKQRKRHIKVDGKKVGGPDQYEAEAFRDAVEFRVFGHSDGAKVEFVGVTRENIREFIDKGCLVYAVTASKRSACVTKRTPAVYDALSRGVNE